MATIDKSLPNTKTEIEIPGEEVIVEEQQEIVERQQGGETEIEMNEDGGATVNFDPSAVNPEGGEDHFENLADFLEDNVLDPLASELMEKYTNYKESRQEWADSYREGLNLLGLDYVEIKIPEGEWISAKKIPIKAQDTKSPKGINRGVFNENSVLLKRINTTTMTTER